MATEAVLGLDVGTTTVKAVLVDRAGSVVASGASEQIATRSPEPGAAEQGLDEIWDAISTAVAEAVSGSDVTVAAIAMATQSGSVCPIGSDDSPYSPVVTWMDTRSAEVVRSWGDAEREQIRSVSGWHAGPGQGLATIAWLQHDWPDLFGAATRFASIDDAVGHRLTGNWVTNPSNASGMQLMDVATSGWSDDLLSMAGVDPGQLSPIVVTGEQLGSLTADAGNRFGLNPGLPVFVGGHDQTCAALALGVTEPGVIMLSVGTAWVLTTVATTGDVAGLPADMNLGPHALTGRWLASTNLGGLGVGLADDEDALPIAVESACAAIRSVAALGDPTEIKVVGGGTRDDRLVALLCGGTGLPVEAFSDLSWPGLGATRIAANAIGWPKSTTPARGDERR
ncbi:MAG: FGGY-family carbohydrate kinase [Actinobacteria bacterium]|nr:FGGY-family carbohydrate kinase [Actinomycetota bacterium]MBT3688270.1 FGGY-family carbohydrate kinase [Actinomycetota bacterium]MBT4036486.1 FGGY-family carbohydrate kinase [Actinomycetota bacterium]MBT4787307.1 FGGY-family carbohydrate kinase [Actinomycetota bacterium]MBT5041802.1 FGGY-family carbohydrate kinase [Actinomycetota bacterium]